MEGRLARLCGDGREALVRYEKKAAIQQRGHDVRIAAYIATFLSSLVWIWASMNAYEYSKVAYGYEKTDALRVQLGACCSKDPSPIFGAFLIALPTVVLTATICFLVSSSVHRRPGIALVCFIALILIGSVFGFNTGLYAGAL
jgi:hypothetical protein